MNKTESIVGLKDIIDRYDVFILDQWGVMHNGEEGYTAAIKCVETLYNCLLYTSPSPRDS